MSTTYESASSCCRGIPAECSAEELARTLPANGRRILVCYGASLPDGIRKTLTDCGMDIRLFEMSGTEPEPLEESVGVGAAICRHEQIDVLLAVGGDVSKDFAVRVADAFRRQNAAGREIAVVFVREP